MESNIQAQWFETGNALTTTGIFGTTSNFDVLFKTDDIDRMRLMETGTYNIDGYNIDNSGFLYLGLTPAALINTEPQSILHIDGTGNLFNNPQEQGYRNWMRPGISFTHNSDRMYIGPKTGNTQDESEAVINWSDNEITFPGLGPDVLRFLFTGEGDGTTSVSSDPLDNEDYDGVEIARMMGDARMGVGPRWTNTLQPKRALDVIDRDDDEPQFRITHTAGFGIAQGDFADFQVDGTGNAFIKPVQNGNTRGLAIGFLDGEDSDPTNDTRLDVGGLTRIRTLTDDDETLECLVAGYSRPGVNDADPEDQFLRRIDFPDDASLYLDGTGTFSTLTDCRWSDVNSVTVVGQTDIFTGVDTGDPSCDRGKVGIGSSSNNLAKLEVLTDEVTDEINSGISSIIRTELDQSTPGINYAIIGEALNTGEKPYPIVGVRGNAKFGKVNVGVYGEAIVNPQILTATNIGVYGIADNQAGTGIGIENIGVYGESIGNGIAGYFAGAVLQSQTPITISDENVKENVLDLEGASEILNQLSPKTYNYLTIEGREHLFEENLQYGFIAQEVQSVLPDIVKDASIPAKFDTSGVLEGTGIELIGIQYEKLVPILVAGFKEQLNITNQQAQIIEDQEETINELENQIDDLSASLGQLQESVAQLNAAVQQNQQKSNDCCEKISNLMGDAGAQGKQSSLEQNVPNPFQETTQIDYNLATNGRVRLIITNELGQPIETLVNGEMSSGQHSVRWDAANAAPGVYYYTLYFNGDLITKKMIKL